jgi:hypothetical protein
MMKLVPLTSVGEIRFDMHPREYESLLGKPNGVFRRTPDSTDQIYTFAGELVHLTVDPYDQVTMISVFRPLMVELGGVQVLGRELKRVAEDLSRTTYRFEPRDVGLWCPEAAVGLVELNDLVDGVEMYSTLVKR